MPGLIEQAMTPEQPTVQASPAQAPPAQAPPVRAGRSSRAGFTQKELDIFVANGIKMIHTDKISDSIISMVVDSKDPVTALADATLSIVSRLEQSSEAAGRKVSYETLVAGANILMGEVIASAEAAGMKKMKKPEKYQAMSLAVAKYLDTAIKTGKMTKEELAQLGEEAANTEIGQKMSQFNGEMPEAAPEEEEE